MKPLQPKYTYRFVCGVLMTALACGMFFFVWYQFVSAHNQTGALLGKGNLGMALGLYIALYVYFGRLVRAFGFGVERKFATVSAQIIALMITDVAEVFLSLAITGQFRFLWSFAWRYFLLWCVQSVAIGLLTSLAIDIYRKKYPPLQLLEIYGDYEDTFWQEVDAVDFKYHVKNRLHYSEGPFGPLLADYDAVLINNVPARLRNDILKLCFARNKRLYFVPKISDIIAGSADSIKLFDTPLYLCRNRGMSNLQWITKRVFDVVLSAAALIVLSPVFAVTALAIKLNDGGPVFYKQERVTKGGKQERTPIFHLCGGDTTEGAHDEWIRHSITKISYLHFVTNEDSRKRVIQLGEAPNRVFCFGSTRLIFSRENDSLCSAFISAMACVILFAEPLLIFSFIALLSAGLLALSSLQGLKELW